MGNIVKSIRTSVDDFQTTISHSKTQAVQRTIDVKNQAIETFHSSVQRQKTRIASLGNGIKHGTKNAKCELQSRLSSAKDSTQDGLRKGCNRLSTEAHKWKERHLTPHRFKVFKYCFLSVLGFAILIPTVLILKDVYYGDYQNAEARCLEIGKFFQNLMIYLWNILLYFLHSVLGLLWNVSCLLYSLSCDICQKLWELSKYIGNQLYELSGWSLVKGYHGIVTALEYSFYALTNTMQFLLTFFQESLRYIYVFLVNTFHLSKYLLKNLYDLTYSISVHVIKFSKIIFHYLFVWGEFSMRHLIWWLRVAGFYSMKVLTYCGNCFFELFCEGAAHLWEFCKILSQNLYEFTCISAVYLKLLSFHLYELACVTLVHARYLSSVAFEYLCISAVHFKHLSLYLCEITYVGWGHFLHASEIALLFAYDMSCKGAVQFVHVAKVSSVYASEYSYRAAIFTWEWSKILSRHIGEGLYYGSIHAWQFSQEAYVYLCNISQDFNKYAEAWSKLTVESASEAIVKGLEWSQVNFEKLANGSYYWSIFLGENAVIYIKEGFEMACVGLQNFVEFSQVAAISSAEFLVSAAANFSEKSQTFAVDTYQAIMAASEWVHDTFNICYDNVAHVILTVTSTILTTVQHVSHVAYQVWGFVFPWSCFILDFLYYISSVTLTFTYKWSSVLLDFVYSWTTFCTVETAKLLHLTLNKCLVRSLCIILVTMLYVLYQIVVYLLQFIGFLFYIVFLFCKRFSATFWAGSMPFWDFCIRPFCYSSTVSNSRSDVSSRESKSCSLSSYFSCGTW